MPNENNHGGVRQPGPGKKLGKPPEMAGGQAVKFYISEDTKNGLLKIDSNRSKALRDAVAFWLEHHPEG